jgi:hypothetical protein
VLAAQHLLDLGSFHFGVERVERSLQIGGDVLARLGPLEQHAEIVELAAERIAQLDFVAETAAPPQRLLRVGRVLPEIGGGYTRFDRRKLAVRVGGVKDSSASLWRA